MTIADQRVNDLVNQLEAGKLSRSAFLRSLGEQGLLGHGIGGLVAKRPGAAAPAGQKDLVRTGVLLKISRRRGSDNRIQGKVKTNALDLEESFVDGFRELNVLGGSGKVQIGGKAVPLAPKAHIRVDHHQLINYKHGGPQPWEFEAVCHPTWDPYTTTYTLGGKSISGGQMWFELKKDPDDPSNGVAYQVMQWSTTRLDIGGASQAPFSRYQGSLCSIAIDDPGHETLTDYNDLDTRIYTAIAGTGTLTVDGKAQSLDRGDAVTVPPNSRTKLTNQGPGSLLVEVRPAHANFWHPDHTFWETSPGKFVPADEVWFELVWPN